MSDLNTIQLTANDKIEETFEVEKTVAEINEVAEEINLKEKKNKKGIWLGLGIVVGLIILGGGGYFIKTKMNNKTNTSISLEENKNEEVQIASFKFKATVVYLDGEVFRQVDGRKVEIKEGDELEEKDIVVTSKEAKLVLEIDDGSIIRIGESSRVSLDSMVTDEMIINQKEGKLFARVNKDEKNKFIIKSGDYEVTSLGTVFSVENEDDEVKVKVFESKVKVEKDGQQLVEVKEEEEWDGKKVAKLAMVEVGKDEFYAWVLRNDISQDKLENEDPTSSRQGGTSNFAKASLDRSLGAGKQEEQKQDSAEQNLKSVNSGAKIVATASQASEGILVNWSIENFTPYYGFKVVWSENNGPTYPGREGDYNHYHTDNGKRSDVITEGSEGKTYHIRVCQYKDGKCLLYSNEVTAVMPAVNKSNNESNSGSGEVKSIILSGEKIGDGKVKLNWSVDGYSSKGFKVVWSKESNPAYPTRSGDHYNYLPDAGERDDEVSGLESGKTYHFRVCEYLGGKCGAYSNDVSIGL